MGTESTELDNMDILDKVGHFRQNLDIFVRVFKIRCVEVRCDARAKKRVSCVTFAKITDPGKIIVRGYFSFISLLKS